MINQREVPLSPESAVLALELAPSVLAALCCAVRSGWQTPFPSGSFGEKHGCCDGTLGNTMRCSPGLNWGRGEALFCAEGDGLCISEMLHTFCLAAYVVSLENRVSCVRKPDAEGHVPYDSARRQVQGR